MKERADKGFIKGIREILVNNYKNNVYSASSVGIYSINDGLPEQTLINLGITEEKKGKKIDNSSIFDLASLTKPLVTLLSILVLVEKGKISFEETLDSLLKRNIPGLLGKVDIYSLLCHSTGLPAHREYWHKLLKIDENEKREWLIKKILTENIEKHSMKSHVYSDLGYILLGFIVETKTGQKLDEFWNMAISEPLDLKKNLFFRRTPPCKKKKYIATGFCQWSNVLLQGLVNDDNCRALGGVGGHAGLFGTTSAVLTLGQELLTLMKGRKSIIPISAETFSNVCSRVGESDWTAGFNLPSKHGSSSGKYFSKKSIGHLGFTGTSFWIDPERDLVVVLLTNRVIKGSDLQGIRKLRPYIHDYIVKNIEKNNKNP